VNTAIVETADPSKMDSMKEILSMISDDTLKELFQEDAQAIQKLNTSIQNVKHILASMQESQDCFDREDADNATRMLRVLNNELDWRVRRLSIAIQEYDSKIIRLLGVMKKRKEILSAHAMLESDDLLKPL
jgi:predicted negative regulator of RcsB-dependent stress response